MMYGHVWAMGIARDWAGFNHSFKYPACLASLKGCDKTKQSVDDRKGPSHYYLNSQKK